MSVFDRIGPDALREVLRDFYDRLFTDSMIGFLFAGKDKQRLIEREWEFTARLLGGAAIRYTGRPMRKAHAASPILGGHFERRLQILRETLADHRVDAEVQAKWLEHTVSLRDQITSDRGSECKNTSVRADPPKARVLFREARQEGPATESQPLGKSSEE